MKAAAQYASALLSTDREELELGRKAYQLAGKVADVADSFDRTPWSPIVGKPEIIAEIQHRYRRRDFIFDPFSEAARRKPDVSLACRRN
jgi:hypothetical protein